jgi:hypothetical protein
MFLLVTGASGAGKSTVRRAIAPTLASDGVECVELHDVIHVPAVPTIAWRQQAVEAAVRRAVGLQARRRHLLLSGDPVAVGEVVAAPSADRLERIAGCLLDLDADAQATRLGERGDDPTLLQRHVAFADWMRAHARVPEHMPHVLRTNAWPQMRLQRGIKGSWDVHAIETSRLSREQAADAVLGWARRALVGQAPVLTVRPASTRGS